MINLIAARRASRGERYSVPDSTGAASRLGSSVAIHHLQALIEAQRTDVLAVLLTYGADANAPGGTTIALPD